MKSAFRLLSFGFLIGLTGCCTTNSSDTISTITLPPSSTVKEMVVLEQVGHPQAQTHKEVVGFLAGVGIDAAAAVAKFLTAQLATAMNSYADEFGASYAGTYRGEDFTDINSGGQKQRLFIFHRTLVANTRAELLDVIHDPIQGTLHPDEKDPTKFDLDIVSIPFVMITSPGYNVSCRFAPATDDDINRALPGYIWAQKPVYQGIKGKVLCLDGIDKFEVLITISLRSAYTSSNSGPNVGTWTGATIKLNGKDLEGLPKKGLKFDADWIPAPAGQAYSLTASVAESSKMKDWIKAASASLSKTADTQIDSWDKSEKQ